MDDRQTELIDKDGKEGLSVSEQQELDVLLGDIKPLYDKVKASSNRFDALTEKRKATFVVGRECPGLTDDEEIEYQNLWSDLMDWIEAELDKGEL